MPKAQSKSSQSEEVRKIPVAEIHPFEGHPFRVVDDELMQQTVDSIMQFGVLSPARRLVVRISPSGLPGALKCAFCLPSNCTAECLHEEIKRAGYYYLPQGIVSIACILKCLINSLKQGHFNCRLCYWFSAACRSKGTPLFVKIVAEGEVPFKHKANYKYPLYIDN